LLNLNLRVITSHVHAGSLHRYLALMLLLHA